jgi:hypothetical protein
MYMLCAHFDLEISDNNNNFFGEFEKKLNSLNFDIRIPNEFTGDNMFCITVLFNFLL